MRARPGVAPAFETKQGRLKKTSPFELGLPLSRCDQRCMPMMILSSPSR